MIELGAVTQLVIPLVIAFVAREIRIATKTIEEGNAMMKVVDELSKKNNKDLDELFARVRILEGLKRS